MRRGIGTGLTSDELHRQLQEEMAAEAALGGGATDATSSGLETAEDDDDDDDDDDDWNDALQAAEAARPRMEAFMARSRERLLWPAAAKRLQDLVAVAAFGGRVRTRKWRTSTCSTIIMSSSSSSSSNTRRHPARGCRRRGRCEREAARRRGRRRRQPA